MALPEPPPGIPPYSEPKCVDARITTQLRSAVENCARQYVLEAEMTDRSDAWFREHFGKISAPLLDHFAGMGGRPMMGKGVGGVVLGAVCPSGGLVEIAKATFDFPWYTLFLNRFLCSAIKQHHELKLAITVRECEVPNVFTCWQLNFGRNVDSERAFFYTQHVDKRNANVNSIGSAIGNYEGGGIWVHSDDTGNPQLEMPVEGMGFQQGAKAPGIILDQRSRWVSFWANKKIHCVLPYRLDRIGFVAFSASTALRLSPERRQMVIDLGFLMPDMDDTRFSPPLHYNKSQAKRGLVPRGMLEAYKKAQAKKPMSTKKVAELVKNTKRVLRDKLFGRSAARTETMFSAAGMPLPKKRLGKRMKRIYQERVMWRHKICDLDPTKRGPNATMVAMHALLADANPPATKIAASILRPALTKVAPKKRRTNSQARRVKRRISQPARAKTARVTKAAVKRVTNKRTRGKPDGLSAFCQQLRQRGLTKFSFALSKAATKIKHLSDAELRAQLSRLGPAAGSNARPRQKPCGSDGRTRQESTQAKTKKHAAGRRACSSARKVATRAVSPPRATIRTCATPRASAPAATRRKMAATAARARRAPGKAHVANGGKARAREAQVEFVRRQTTRKPQKGVTSKPKNGNRGRAHVKKAPARTARQPKKGVTLKPKNGNRARVQAKRAPARTARKPQKGVTSKPKNGNRARAQVKRAPARTARKPKKGVTLKPKNGNRARAKVKRTPARTAQLPRKAAAFKTKNGSRVRAKVKMAPARAVQKPRKGAALKTKNGSRARAQVKTAPARAARKPRKGAALKAKNASSVRPRVQRPPARAAQKPRQVVALKTKNGNRIRVQVKREPTQKPKRMITLQHTKGKITSSQVKREYTQTTLDAGKRRVTNDGLAVPGRSPGIARGRQKSVSPVGRGSEGRRSSMKLARAKTKQVRIVGAMKGLGWGLRRSTGTARSKSAALAGKINTRQTRGERRSKIASTVSKQGSRKRTSVNQAAKRILPAAKRIGVMKRVKVGLRPTVGKQVRVLNPQNRDETHSGGTGRWASSQAVNRKSAIPDSERPSTREAKTLALTAREVEYETCQALKDNGSSLHLLAQPKDQ